MMFTEIPFPILRCCCFFSDEYFLLQMCLFTLDTTRLVKKNLVFKRDYYILFYNSVFSPSPLVCKIV